MPAAGALRPRRPLHRRAARHVGRGAHRALRWAGSFAAVVILLAAFAIWRLMQGPIELNWLTPYVAATMQRSGIGIKVAISGVRFGIDRATHQLDLRAEDVRLSLPDGAPLARFPEMATSFGLGQLLRGRIAPTQVVVERPVLHLVRSATGAISARVGSGDAAAPDLGPQLLERLAGPPERHAPFGLLHRISIRGATLIVDDRQSGRTWRADRVDFAVERSPKGARGDVSFAVPVGGSTPQLHARYRFLAGRQLLDLDLSIDGVEPAAIPPLIPELAQLRHVEAPISGTLQTRIDLKAGRAQGSRLDLALGRGRVHSEWLPAGSIAVGGGEVHATYAPESDEIRIDSAVLDLGGGTRLMLDGSLAGVTPELIAAPADARPPGHVMAKLAGRLTHVPADRLADLWPMAFSPGARDWAQANIHDGMLDEAVVRLALDLDPVGHAATVLSADGSLRFHGLTVGYLKGLPAVRQVDGTAVFAGHHLYFTPTAGTLKGLRVTGGSLRITDLGSRVEWLTIDLAVAGPLKDALDVLDTKPLLYAHALGLDPAGIDGRSETQLHFKLPLLAALKLDAVEYGCTATITGASIPNVALDRTLSDGNFAIDLGRVGAHLSGNARFDGIPAQLDASVLFHPKADGPHAVYRVAMTLDEAAQQKLGFDLAADRLSGPVAVDATYRTFAAKRGEATARLDFRGAALALPEAGWKKPRGEAAVAKVVLDLDNDRITRVRQIDASAPGLDGRFTAQLDGAGGRLERVGIRRLAVGNDQLSGIVTRRAAGGWRADIHAVRIDARPLFKQAMNEAPSASAPPLAVTARIDRLVLGPQRELRQANLELLRTAGAWQSGHIDGRFAGGHQLSLRFGEGGGDRLTFQSDDLGDSLKLLGIADDVVGGRVRVDGELAQIAGKRVLRAHLEGQNYVVTRAPVLARLLALPSLTGLASALSGSGLPFTTVRGDLAYGGGRITLERLLAFGEALGITARGWVDLDRDRLELQGTVAPAYAVNSILGNVPIIGPLLGGGSQGLIAANYRLGGATAQPQVAVNPLSALAPGFLRQLFAPLVGFPQTPAGRGSALDGQSSGSSVSQADSGGP